MVPRSPPRTQPLLSGRGARSIVASQADSDSANAGQVEAVAIRMYQEDHSSGGRHQPALIAFYALDKPRSPTGNPSEVHATDQLADLDQVAVGVPHIAPDLAATIDRWGKKLGPAAAPQLI